MDGRLLGLAETALDAQFFEQEAGRAAARRSAESWIVALRAGQSRAVASRAVTWRAGASRAAESRRVDSRATAKRAVALRAAQSRAVASRAGAWRTVRRSAESAASASDGSCVASCALAGRAAEESFAADRVALRAVEGVAAPRKVRRSSRSNAREVPAAAFSGFLRARSHWAKRACTSASTHSSKISCSSLRRLATVFRRLRWKDSMEASDEAKRYSKGRSMASSRDAESCFASPLELGIGFIDNTRVITSYSTGVAVPVRGGAGAAAVRTNAEMGAVGRRFTDEKSGPKASDSLDPHRMRFRGEAAIGGLRVSKGAQASFLLRLPARPVPLKSERQRKAAPQSTSGRGQRAGCRGYKRISGCF